MLNHVHSNWSKWSSKVKRVLKIDTSNPAQKNNTQIDIPAIDSSQIDEKASQEGSNQHLSIAKESLEFMLLDKRIPDQVRDSLSNDYNQIQMMLDKLEQEQVHISVLGRVSVGKSSLLNVLMGDNKFSVSPLHGETKKPQLSSWKKSSEDESSNWKEYHANNVFFIDTPGINEVDGLAREKMAMEVVSRSDIILYVVDGDITDTEYRALKQVANGVQPVILVLNKVDRYLKKEKDLLLSSLKERVKGLIRKEYVVTSQSQKSLKYFIKVDNEANETEFTEEIDVDVKDLKLLLYDVLKKEGKTLAALNAVFFAGKLSEQIGIRLIENQKNIAGKVIHTYSIAKGVAVAINPIPIADLMAAALIDAGLVIHLSKVYGLSISTAEAGELVKAIMSQMIILMGSIWGMNLISSAFKLGSFGLSTVLTASAQGTIAYYGTFVVGNAANFYFEQGKSWGNLGPKQAVKKILDSIDRDSIISQAKEDIMDKIKNK